MEKYSKYLRYFVYIALFLGAAWVSAIGYGQIATARSERALDRSTWLPKEQINRLMRLHGTDVLKITSDEVFIPRGWKWVSVLRRGRD
jgi:hypothetical protein